MGALTCLTLAQSDKPQATDAMLWAIVMVIAVIALGAAVVALRHHWLAKAHRPAQSLGLGQIDELYEGGQISREEYNRLRRAAFGGLLDAGQQPGKPTNNPDQLMVGKPAGQSATSEGQEAMETGNSEDAGTR